MFSTQQLFTRDTDSELCPFYFASQVGGAAAAADSVTARALTVRVLLFLRDHPEIDLQSNIVYYLTYCPAQLRVANTQLCHITSGGYTIHVRIPRLAGWLTKWVWVQPESTHAQSFNYTDSK